MKNCINFQPPAIRYIFTCALLVFGVSIYWPGLSGGFFFDDSINIIEPLSVRLKNISTESVINVWESGVAGPLGRPVSMLSFALNYYFSEFDPFYFKLTNLVIHSLNAVLVYYLVSLFARGSEASSNHTDSRMFAVMVGAIWLVHPIQLTSVLYVVQRMTSLAAFFTLAALILHVWARQRATTGKLELFCYTLSWGLFFPAALLSKESGILFLLYVAAYEAIIQRKFKQQFDSFGRFYIWAIIFATIALIAYLFVPDVGLMRGYETRDFTLFQRLLTESRIFWEYVRLIVAPALSNFSLYHDDIVVSTGFFNPKTTLLAVVGYLLLPVLCWAIRKKAPLASFGILWFLVGHSLESTIFPLELMHEHRNYLPSLGVFMAIGVVLQSLYLSGGSSKVLASTLMWAFFFYASLLTWFRADMFGEDFRRTQIEAGYRPDSVRAQYEAGALLVNMYAIQASPISVSFAEKHFERVNALDPNFKLALIGQLQLDCLSGSESRTDAFVELRARLANRRWVPMDRAVMHGIAEMSNAGTICLSRGQVDELFAVAIGNQSTTIHDRSVVRSDYVLYLWIGQNDYPAARNVLLDAINENNDDLLNRINLLQLSRFLGDREGVLKSLKYLDGKSLNRLDRRLVQSVIDEMRAEEGVMHGSSS